MKTDVKDCRSACAYQQDSRVSSFGWVDFHSAGVDQKDCGSASVGQDFHNACAYLHCRSGCVARVDFRSASVCPERDSCIACFFLETDFRIDDEVRAQCLAR